MTPTNDAKAPYLIDTGEEDRPLGDPPLPTASLVGPSSSPALVGEPLDAYEDDEEEGDDVYRIIIRRKKMEFGDSMIHARFAVLLDQLSETEELPEDATPAAKTAARVANMHAVREMMDGFDELCAYLDRVAKVLRNGERVPARRIPQYFVPEVMDAINRERSKMMSKN